MSFSGKKIAITGSGRGFGRTLAVNFARAGAELFLSARNLAKAEETAGLLRELAPQARVHVFQCDVAKPEDIAQFAAAVTTITPSIDILINNASYWLSQGLLEASDADLLEAINSTTTGAILATKHFLPLLTRSSAPDIVFMNGTPGLLRNRHSFANEAFAAAKSGQAAFSDRLRSRFRTTGLRVLTIYPPDFRNTSPLDEAEWERRRDERDERKMTARNIFDCVRFALSQDRICSIDEIVLSNNNGDDVGN
jgi:NAD(P)-dependent dehydrogenase (short-subunit alcohol dehydrogenase family)